MEPSAIPAIERRFSKPMFFLNAASLYLTTLPVHWVLTRLGVKQGLLPVIMRMSEGRHGGKKAFASYTPTSADVIVSTFAKSGTNWMMQLVHQTLFHGAGEFENIHDVVPWPDMQSGLVNKSIALESDLVQKTSPEHKRVIKTHLAAQWVPYNATAHYVVVIRDPKEVFVSSYHFACGSYGPLMPSLDAWFDLFFTRNFPLGCGSTWAEHTAGYWALRNKPNVAVIFFSDMKRDLRAVAQRIAGFLAVALTPDEMHKVIERSSFEWMSRVDHKFLATPKENVPWGKSLKMMREGKSGNSQELLSREQQQRIDRHFKAELTTLGSDFPYDEYFGRSGL